MEVAKLVEQRKLGQITQEDFFIRLNELRRANITARSSSSHDDLDDEKQQKPTTSVSKAIGQPSQEPEGKKDSSEARDSIVVDGEVEAELRQARGDESDTAAPALVGQDAGPRRQPSAVDLLLLDEVDSGIPAACAEGTIVDEVRRQQQNAGRVREHEFDRNSVVVHEPWLVVPQSHVVVCSTGSTSVPTTPPAHTHIPSNVSEDAKVPVVDGRRLQKLISSKELDREEEDSEWLTTPMGETHCLPRARKTCASRGASSRSSPGTGAREGEFFDTVDCSGVLPQRSRTLNGQARSRRWIPAGARSPRAWSIVTNVLSAASRNPPSISAPGRGQGCRRNYPIDSNPLREESTALEKSAGMSRLEEARRRVLSSSSPQRRETGSDTWRKVGSTPTAGKPVWPEARRNSSGIDNDMSDDDMRDDDSSLPSGTRIRRSQSPHEERHERCSSTGKRVSSSASVRSSERGWSVDRNQSRRDRYGYPLHERGGLGAIDERACNSSNHLFAPMIKGLPEFYQTRPRRSVDHLRGRVKPCTSATDKGQQGLVYERSTRWLAKADNDRRATRKLACLSGCCLDPVVDDVLMGRCSA